jgi:hypothetical protein
VLPICSKSEAFRVIATIKDTTGFIGPVANEVRIGSRRYAVTFSPANTTRGGLIHFNTTI